MRNQRPGGWLVLAIVGAVGLITTLVFWQALARGEEDAISETTGLETENLAVQLSAEVDQHIMVLTRMSDRWQFEGRPVERAWVQAAELIVNDFPGFVSIAWINRSLETRWVAADAASTESASSTHDAGSERRQDLTQAQDEDQTLVVTTPAGPVSEDGRILIYQPVYVNPDPTVPEFFNEGRNFDGFIAGALSKSQIVEGVLGQASRDGYGFTVSVDGHEIHPNDDGQTRDDPRASVASFSMGGREWQLELWPEQSALERQQSGLPVVALIGGLFGTGLILALIHLLQASRQRTAEARALNLELTKATMALESSNRSLEEFAYIASHDLKSPLVTMQGLADIMQEDYGDAMPDEAQTYLSRIQVNARRMQNLLDGVLRVSGMHHADEAFTDVRLADTVDAAREQLAQLISERGATVRVVDRLPVVHGNPTWLQQIVLNLIENAITYAHRDRRPVIEIGCRERDDAWEVYVRDNGPGIPAHYSNRLFAMFQRLPDSNVANPAGTGMGLAIVAKSVKAHGGEVWIDESSDSGTTFAFTIPRAPAGNPADAASTR